MNYAILYCVSDADTKYEATVEVRDCLADHLVNVDVDDESVPIGISKEDIPGELTFYWARATGGGLFNNRPYSDLNIFLDEFQSVLGHDMYRIARFEQEQNSRIYSEDKMVDIDDNNERFRTFARDLMDRVNQMNIKSGYSLLGKIFTDLSFKIVNDDNLIFDVDSHLYSMGLNNDSLSFSEYKRNDGPWIVHDAESFDGGVHDLYSETYFLDCTCNYPNAVSSDHITDGTARFIVEVETKY